MILQVIGVVGAVLLFIFVCVRLYWWLAFGDYTSSVYYKYLKYRQQKERRKEFDRANKYRKHL